MTETDSAPRSVETDRVSEQLVVTKSLSNNTRLGALDTTATVLPMLMAHVTTMAMPGRPRWSEALARALEFVRN